MTQSGHGSPFGYKVDFTGSTPADERVVARYKAFEVYNKAVQKVDRCQESLQDLKRKVNSSEVELSNAVHEMLRAKAKVEEAMEVKGDDVKSAIRQAKGEDRGVPV